MRRQRRWQCAWRRHSSGRVARGPRHKRSRRGTPVGREEEVEEPGIEDSSDQLGKVLLFTNILKRQDPTKASTNNSRWHMSHFGTDTVAATEAGGQVVCDVYIMVIARRGWPHRCSRARAPKVVQCRWCGRMPEVAMVVEGKGQR